MGSGYKKSNQVDMGFYVPNKKEKLAYSWCINNGIYISPKPANSSTWHLLIEINKKINISPDAYKKVEIWKQLFKFYTYYYDKYANTK
jgi:radical SAM superfamily enzyme